jgi:threonylcarbamoyladenosine tRNA methylthiotransferase MtaB
MAVPRQGRVSLYTLGCRVNQYETRETAAELVRLGYRIVPFGQPADACVVNTCSVTDQADSKSRSALRRARRSGDEPLVVATGCYVETAPEAVNALPGITAVVPNADKPRLAEIVDEAVRRSGRLLYELPGEPVDAQVAHEPAGGLITLLREGEGVMARTRAVVKIQDGCNHFCSFCIIPFTRGRLRSRDAASVLEEATSLADQGFQELVLTGICLGDYGDECHGPQHDRDPLAVLLEQLSKIPGLRRIRLSSLDPADTSPDLIRTMAALPQVCRHLHLSLQSGSEEILQRMRRRYTAVQFRDLVASIYDAMPDAGLTCDVITGFPGEGPEQFADTERLCETSRFLHIHAFPYSPRAGTQAARLADDVPPAVKQARVRSLGRLSDELALAFAERHLGETVPVLVEQRDRGSGMLTGLTGSYLRVFLEGPDALRGNLVPVEIRSAGSGGATGTYEPDVPPT